MPTSLTAEPIDVVVWDEGRLHVHAGFAEWLSELELTTWDAFSRLGPGEVYRAVGERVTSRIEFATKDGRRGVFIKRHGRITWRERWKCALRLQSPAWGAKPEWDAILAFHRLGIPTMTPIVYGEWQGRSFLITDALEDCVRLDHWFARSDVLVDREQRRQLLRTLAGHVRRMHAGGWHHQDLYLCHILWSPSPASTTTEPSLHVIDLGRVQKHTTWTAWRWILKDLSQLHYSADNISRAEQLRFLKWYLGRDLTARDRTLIRWILRKSARIARHTVRHGL